MGFHKITHRERVRSSADCVKLIRALGGREVLVDGWRTSEPRAIEELVAAAVATPSTFTSGSTLAYRDGHFDDAVWAALGELAASRCDHVSVETPSATLRLWPSLVGVGPHAPSWARFPARIETDGPRNKIETADIADACATFRQLAGPTFTGGSLAVHVDPVPAALARFVIAARAQLSAKLVLLLDVADKLAATIGGDALDWQGGGIHVRFPAGEITSIVDLGAPPERHAENEARVTAAFRQAKLR